MSNKDLGILLKGKKKIINKEIEHPGKYSITRNLWKF